MAQKVFISFAILTAACQLAEVLNDQVRGNQDEQGVHTRTVDCHPLTVTLAVITH